MNSVYTLVWLTDWELFLDLMDGGAYPFLVGGVICLVNSDNKVNESVVSGACSENLPCIFAFPSLCIVK